MTYNLPALATRDRSFRVITPTAIQEGEALRLLTPILRTWRDSAAVSLALYAQNASADQLADQDNHTERALAALLIGLKWRTLFERIETWHCAKWLSSVSAATGVDVRWLVEAPIRGFAGVVAAPSTVTSQGGLVSVARQAARGHFETLNRTTAIAIPSPSLVYPVSGGGSLSGGAQIANVIDDAAASASNLAKSLSDEAQNRINQAMAAGRRTGASASDVARAINAGLAKSRRRAGGIAENEVDNAVKAFTDARMAEAGLSFAKWHHTAQRNPRPDHLAKDGKLYKNDDSVWNLQYLPNCKCAKVPVLKIGKFSGI
jgi:hypothetical protein